MKSDPVRLGRVPGDRDKFYISFAFQGSAREINGFPEIFFATLSKDGFRKVFTKQFSELKSGDDPTSYQNSVLAVGDKNIYLKSSKLLPTTLLELRINSFQSCEPKMTRHLSLDVASNQYLILKT